MELVAEMSGCHGGNLENAVKWIKVAKSVGADAVKFQIYSPKALAEKRAADGRGTYDELHDLYKRTFTPTYWFNELIAMAKDQEIPWFSSVFSKDDIDFAETMDCPRYKIASFEAKDLDLIKYAASKNKPMILSINQDASWDHMAKAVLTADNLVEPLTVLHATNYGVKMKDCKIHRVAQMKRELAKHVHFGLSDHTTSQVAAVMAAGVGANMIERHMKLTNVPTPDDAFASYPDEMEHLIMAIKYTIGAVEPRDRTRRYI